MSRPVRALAAFCLLLCASSCAPRSNTVTVAGSTAFLPFAEKLAEEFVAAHPQDAVTVQGGGSAVGIQAALSGAAQIGMADLVELPREAAGLLSVVVARDGIALVVHPTNPVGDLTLAQIRAVYDGSIRRWKELGGADLPITVVSRESGSGTRSSFEAILGGLRLTQDSVIEDSNGSIRETVAHDPGAVGYVSLGLLDERIKAVRIGGVRPAAEEILAGSYVLVRPVYFLTLAARAPAASAFIDYVLGSEGQRIISDAGLLGAPAPSASR